MPETATEVDGDKYDITKALSQVTYNMSGVSLKLGSKDNGDPKHGEYLHYFCFLQAVRSSIHVNMTLIC